MNSYIYQFLLKIKSTKPERIHGIGASIAHTLGNKTFFLLKALNYESFAFVNFRDLHFLFLFLFNKSAQTYSDFLTAIYLTAQTWIFFVV